MKKWVVLIFCLLIGLAGCSSKEGTLEWIDVEKKDMQALEHKILEKDQLKQIEEMMERVKWEEAKVEMARKEDVKLTFYYEFDPNMPERLEEYMIWFNKGNTAELVDPNKHRYGKLNKEDTQKLKAAIKS